VILFTQQQTSLDRAQEIAWTACTQEDQEKEGGGEDGREAYEEKEVEWRRR
jgi:hypothetical protein